MGVRSLIALLVVVASLSALSDAVRPGQKPQSSRESKILQNRYIVELAGKPIARGGIEAHVKEQHESIHRAAIHAGIRYKTISEFRHVYNGFSVQVESSVALEKLESLSGVKKVHSVHLIQAPRHEEKAFAADADILKEQGRSSSSTPSNVLSALNMIGALSAHEMGINGQSVRVAVIDTGIDYTHPDLGHGFGLNHKVAYGYDFVGTNISAPMPNADPKDCKGCGSDCLAHGTHVAGTIAANGYIKGVAPRVTLGAYKISDCTGTTSDDIVMQAIEMAVMDGMNIINFSFGASFCWWQETMPMVSAFQSAVSANVIVVAAAGNEGQYGTFTLDSPASAPGLISVAAVENTIAPKPMLLIYSPDLVNALTFAPFANQLPLRTNHWAPLVKVPGADHCTPLDAGTYHSTYALIPQTSSCSFATQAMNAAAAGATAAVFYLASESDSLYQADAMGATFPMVLVSAADGAYLDGLMALEHTTYALVAPAGQLAPAPYGGYMAEFSSVGPGYDLRFGPTVAAPGGQIMSTQPGNMYAIWDGTSMATPHVTGAVALLYQSLAKAGKSPSVIAKTVQRSLTNYAKPVRGLTSPYAPQIQQGAGLIQINASIAFGDSFQLYKSVVQMSDVSSKDVSILLVNDHPSGQPMTFTLTHVTGTAVSVYDPVSAENAAVMATAEVASTTVNVAGHRSVRFNVTLSAPNPAFYTRYAYGGWLKATTSTGVSLCVPYMGLVGPFTALPIVSYAEVRIYTNFEYRVVDPTQYQAMNASTDVLSVVFGLALPAKAIRGIIYKQLSSGAREQLGYAVMQVSIQELDGYTYGDYIYGEYPTLIQGNYQLFIFGYYVDEATQSWAVQVNTDMVVELEIQRAEGEAGVPRVEKLVSPMFNLQYTASSSSVVEPPTTAVPAAPVQVSEALDAVKAKAEAFKPSAKFGLTKVAAA